MDEVRTVIIDNKKFMLNENAYIEYIKLKKENDLLKEEIKELRNAINNCYDIMYSLRVIYDYEEKKQEDIEEI